MTRKASPSPAGKAASRPPAAGAPDLAARLVAGDGSAYQELVQIHGPRLLAVARRILPRMHDAEDAVQDAYFSVVRNISRFRRGSSLETWLHRVVVNCALMIVRRQRRKPLTSLTLAGGESAAFDGAAGRPRLAPDPPSAHDVVVTRESLHVLHRAIAGLPASQRRILRICHVSGLSVKEAAPLVGVPAGRARSALHRARTHLATSLRGVGG